MTQLALDSKVDKVVGKNLSTEDFTTAEKTKLASLGGAQDLSLFAPLLSPSLLGIPTAPTATLGTNSTQLATTAFVANAVNNSVGGSFVDLTTNQTIGGNKTFNSDIIANGLIIGKGKGQNNYNTVFGAGALNSSNANGTRNTAIGYLALTQYAGTTFDNNTGVGYFNMIGLTTGYGNTSIGAETMFNVGTASNNTGIGNQSLINAAGDNNVGVGARSGDGLTTGTNNTFIGTQARTTSAGATITNATALGYGAVVTENNTIQLGNLGVTNVKTSGKLTTGAITLPNTDGTTGQILTTNGAGVVAWSSPTNISISTINETPNSNGATIANGVIKLSPADATNGGIVTTGNQTFSGNKIVIGNFETQTSMDTPVKDINANNPTSPVGAPDQEARQSFTAGISGYLSNIKVKLFSSGTYTVSIYKGGNVMSENNPGGIQLFQSTFTSINNVMSSIPITNTPITAGDIYWIKISGPSLNVGLNWGQNNVGTTVSFPTYHGGLSQSWIFETYVSQLIGGNITVAGSITSSGFKTPTGTSSQYLMADGSVSSSSTGSSSQWTTSNDDIYYTAGKVGIGLSNPGNSFNTNLDVAGRSSFRINSSTNALIMDGSTGFSRIYTDATSGSPDDLILGTYPNGHMKQVFLKQSNGYVGINNDNPSEQLDVTGSIKATGFKTPTGTSSQYLMADGSVSDTSSYGNNVFNTVSTPIESLNNFNVSQVGILIVTGIYDSTLNFYGLKGGVKGQIVYLINNCSSSSGYLQALQAVPNSILAIQKFKSKDPNNNSTYISNRTATLIYDGEFWHVLTGGY